MYVYAVVLLSAFDDAELEGLSVKVLATSGKRVLTASFPPSAIEDECISVSDPVLKKTAHPSVPSWSSTRSSEVGFPAVPTLG